MRDYGRVYSNFWSSTDMAALTDDGRMLALYLLSGPHGTIAGVCRLPDGYVSEDLKWTSQRVAKGFIELSAKGFANRCDTTKWVWIRKYLLWNTPENPNQWKAARKIAALVPTNCAWKAQFDSVFGVSAGDFPPDESNPLGTVREPLPNQDQEQEKYQEQDLEQESDTSPEAPDDAQLVFDHWRQTHNHPQSNFDMKRRRLVLKCLRQYSVATLCQSISGYLNSPHHMGQNKNNTRYDSLELLLRDANHIDAGLKFHVEPPRADLSDKTRRIIDQTEGWAPPEVRNAAH